MVKCAIGQDSHKFESDETHKRLMLAGVFIPEGRGLAANSDGDVVFHALTNAVSGISGINILGSVADKLCLEKKITDSGAYLEEALKTLGKFKITHVSVSIECKDPRLSPHIEFMRKEIAHRMSVNISDVGITATTGEGLTAFGKGEGIQAFAVVTAQAHA